MAFWSGKPIWVLQADLAKRTFWAIIGLDNSLAIVAIEAKAGESFGKYVRDWRNGSDGKETRLMSLCKTLGLSLDEAMPLRYQLLHRAASAILEAKRYRTKTAILLVHSFCDDPRGFEDFSAFMQALSFEAPAPGNLVGPVVRDGISLYGGWVQGKVPKGGSSGAYLATLRRYATKLERECKRVGAWCDEQLSKR